MASRARSEAIGGLVDRASRQSHIVTTRQLDQDGLGQNAIAAMRRQGWLVGVRPGAHLVGGGMPTEWQQVVAAALVAGPGAVVSHFTAARVHHLPHLVPAQSIELTAVEPCRPRLRGVQIHRVSRLASADLGQHRGVPVTTPSRTICDLAGRLAPSLLSRVIDEGLVQRMWTAASVLAAMERAGPRPGVTALRELLAWRRDEAGIESSLEQRAVRILAPFRPFEIGHQVVVGGTAYLLDIAWPAWKVAVESDGFGPHGRSRERFDRDRRRGNALLADGWAVVHFTSAMSDLDLLTDVGCLLPAHISGALSQRGR